MEAPKLVEPSTGLKPPRARAIHFTMRSFPRCRTCRIYATKTRSQRDGRDLEGFIFGMPAILECNVLLARMPEESLTSSLSSKGNTTQPRSKNLRNLQGQVQLVRAAGPILTE